MQFFVDDMSPICRRYVDDMSSMVAPNSSTIRRRCVADGDDWARLPRRWYSWGCKWAHEYHRGNRGRNRPSV